MLTATARGRVLHCNAKPRDVATTTSILQPSKHATTPTARIRATAMEAQHPSRFDARLLNVAMVTRIVQQERTASRRRLGWIHHNATEPTLLKSCSARAPDAVTRTSTSRTTSSATSEARPILGAKGAALLQASIVETRCPAPQGVVTALPPPMSKFAMTGTTTPVEPAVLIARQFRRSRTRLGPSPSAPSIHTSTERH